MQIVLYINFFVDFVFHLREFLPIPEPEREQIYTMKI